MQSHENKFDEKTTRTRNPQGKEMRSTFVWHDRDPSPSHRGLRREAHLPRKSTLISLIMVLESVHRVAVDWAREELSEMKPRVRGQDGPPDVIHDPDWPGPSPERACRQAEPTTPETHTLTVWSVLQVPVQQALIDCFWRRS
jgi:hypothetical protein